MPEFLIDFADAAADGTIIVHDTKQRKKPLARGENVRVYDASGNSALGFIEKHDVEANLYWLAIDRSTYRSAIIA